LDVGIISIVPVVITLIIAVWSRNVIFGLVMGVFAGVLILNGPNPFTATSTMVQDYLVAQAATRSHMGILLLMIFIAGLVGLMEKSGGAAAFAGMMIKYIKGKTKAQIGAWVSGSLLFFTDSGTPLIVGPLFRPITDKLKVSRAKLAWIVDSTASPVAVLVPFIGWGIYSQDLIAAQYQDLGISGSAFEAYVKAVPFQIYSVLAVIMVPAIILLKADFGPMKTAEDNCEKGIVLESAEVLAAEQVKDTQADRAKPIMVWLPLGVMLTVMFALLVPQGFPNHMENMKDSAFRGALSTGYVFAAIVLMGLMALYKVRSLADGFSLYLKSMSNIIGVLAILVLAWSLSALGDQLGTATYISSLADGRLPPFLIPASAFLVGGIISFSTGSSWGTYAILFPIILPMAHEFDAPLIVSIGAVLSGGLFGDHCSPISDTTILSATGAGCAQLDHVKTQIPYALFNGACSLIAFIMAGLTGSVWALALGVFLLMTGLLLARRWRT
jgi:Na+/H+ antiporter NhaC